MLPLHLVRLSPLLVRNLHIASALSSTCSTYTSFHGLNHPLSPSSMPRASVISVSHGGGPMPYLGDPHQAELAQSMRTKVPKVLKLNTPEAPRAIVIVTAHWETDIVTISNGEKHDLLYDYDGFPKEAYEIEYPAPGSKEVARLVGEALGKAGVKWKGDERRGWDHGVFIPMILTHPAASTPIVQVSVLASQSPAALFAMGEALAPLRDQNIAIVGSGSASNHNMQMLIQNLSGIPNNNAAKLVKWNERMDEGAMEPNMEKRRDKFLEWRSWDGAYDAHPRGRAEHFSPLVVCAGAGGEGEAGMWEDLFAGFKMHTYYWD